MLESILGLSRNGGGIQEVLSALSNLSGRGQTEERALLTVAAVSDLALTIVSGDGDKTEAVVNQLMVVYNEASNVALRCCVLNSLTALAVASILVQGATAPWAEELYALLQSTTTSSSHRHMKQSIATADALNATAILALAELKQADPNLGRPQSATGGSLRSLRSSVPAPIGKIQNQSLTAVKAAAEVSSAMQTLHSGTIFQVPMLCVAGERVGEKRLLVSGPQGVENPLERDRLISSRDAIREAATLSPLLPRTMLPLLAKSLAVVWNYDQIGVDTFSGSIIKALVGSSARSAMLMTASSSAAVRYCRHMVETAKSLALQPAAFVPCSTAAEAQGLISGLQGLGKEYAFSNGPEGLGVYLRSVGPSSFSPADSLQSLVDLPLLSAAERSLLLVAHGEQFRRLNPALYGAHLRYDTPLIFGQRMKAAGRAQNYQQVFAALRAVRDKGWHAATTRSTAALVLADLAINERSCVQQTASVLCSFPPQLVQQTFAATYARQCALRYTPRRQRCSSAASTSRRSAVSGVLMVPDFQVRDGSDADHGEPSTLEPHALLLWHFCSNLLVNGTPSQVVHFFPVLANAFDCVVPNKLLLLEHLTARIPELDNSWTVGNWLLSCVRNLLVSEVRLLDQHETLSLSSLTHAFLNGMISHFSDCAISQHCAIIQNLLSHVPLCTTASLLSVSADDAEDILSLCHQRKETAVALPSAGTVRVFRVPNPARSPENDNTLVLTVTVERASDVPVLAGTVELFADEERHHRVTSYPIAGLTDDFPSCTFSTHIGIDESREYCFFATYRGPLTAQTIAEPLRIPFGDLLCLPATIVPSSKFTEPHVSICTVALPQLLELLQSRDLECTEGTLLSVKAVPDTTVEILLVEKDGDDADSLLFIAHVRAASWQCLQLFEEWLSNGGHQ